MKDTKPKQKSEKPLFQKPDQPNERVVNPMDAVRNLHAAPKPPTKEK
jgi:hypothetical protein